MKERKEYKDKTCLCCSRSAFVPTRAMTGGVDLDGEDEGEGEPPASAPRIFASTLSRESRDDYMLERGGKQTKNIRRRRKERRGASETNNRPLRTNGERRKVMRDSQETR